MCNSNTRWKGENISSSEVENVVLSSSSVSECVVFGRAVQGNEGEMGVAVVVLKEAESLSIIDEIVNLSSENLNPAGKPRIYR